MTRLTQSIVNLTRLTSLSTRVLADTTGTTAFVQRPPSYTLPAFGIPVAGYVAGGYDGANISGIDKITFPADTKTTLTATLTSARSAVSGFASSGVAGYAAGGSASGYLSGIDKITFPADTKTTLTATLTSLRADAAGFADSGVL